MNKVVTNLATKRQAENLNDRPRDEIAGYHLMDEGRLVGGLAERAIFTDAERRRIADLARRFVENAPKRPGHPWRT